MQEYCYLQLYLFEPLHSVLSHSLSKISSFSSMSTHTKPAKKRGNPGDFQGQRAEFLESYQAKYAEKSRSKTTPELWRELFPAYWAKFHWSLPLTEDPSEPEIIEPLPQLAEVVDGSPPPQPAEVLSPEEAARKQAVMVATERVSILMHILFCSLVFDASGHWTPRVFFFSNCNAF